jgi:tryptophan synthase alpha chain
MKNKIERLFKTKANNILSIYFTAGFPELNQTTEIITHLENAGVDLIEIGIPFSDPLADGPVIQESSKIAIENGMNLKLLFQQLIEIKNTCKVPLILMGYLNPILQYGEEQFIRDCKKAGIDGIIIPDMPLDYFEVNLKSLCEAAEIYNILLITPETNDERIKLIDDYSKGFIYMVSSNSITGSFSQFNNQQSYFERIEKMNLKNKTLIGFGIKNKTSFETACNNSSGGIIGSAFIQHLTYNGVSDESIKTFIKSFKNENEFNLKANFVAKLSD